MFEKLQRYGTLGALLLLLTATAVILLLKGVHVQTDFLALLPQTDSPGGAAFERMARAGGRQIHLLAEGDSEQEVTQRLSSLCADLPAGVQPALGKSTLDELKEAFRPYRFQLLSARHRCMLEQERFEELHEEGMANLYGFVSLSFYAADEDPYAFATTFLLESPILKRGAFVPQGDLLLAQRDGKYYGYIPLLLPESVQGSPAELARYLQPLMEQCHVLEVRISGTPVHTFLAASSASSAMSWLGICSTVMVMFVFLWVFSSLRGLLIMVLTVLCSALVSVAAVVAIHGEVHILALVFGCSLVGISTDYMVHYLVAHSLNADSRVGRGLAISLLLGLSTSCLGYAMFYSSGIDLLGQIATVSVVGLCTAILVIFAVYPRAYARHVPVPVSPALLRFTEKAQQRWRVHGLVPWLLALVLAGLALCRLTVCDDLRSFYEPPADLLAAERKMAELNGMEQGVGVLLVHGDNEEQVLQRQEQLAERLAKDGIPITCVASVVPSAARQQQNFAMVQALSDRFADELPLDLPKSLQLLTPDKLFAACPSFAYLASLWDARCGTVLVPGKYRERLTEYAGKYVQPADRFAELEAHIRRWRVLLMWQLGGVLLLGMLVQLCFYGFRAALLISGPPVAGVVSVFAGLAWLGVPLSLFHVLACFLVVGLGYDYSIFCAGLPRNARTGVAVGLSFFTTLCMFGVLAFTSFSVTHDMGMAICLGLSVAYGLSTAATGAAVRPCKVSCGPMR